MIKNELTVLVDALSDPFLKFGRVSDNVITAKHRADSRRVQGRLCQTRMSHRQLGCCDAHLNFAAHQLEPLFDVSLELFIEFAKILDFAFELVALATNVYREIVDGN